MPTTTQPESKLKPGTSLIRIGLAVSALILVLLGILSLPPNARAASQAQAPSTSIPQPTATFDPKRLQKPVLAAENTEQLKKGSTVYWGVCMPCHGDRGQGLTEEWKDAYGAEDRNCWKSGCHGSDHAPKTFLFPQGKVAPAIAGVGSLVSFRNSQDLHDFILANMPWWDPGQLTDTEAWQVSAYVLNLHKVMPADFVLADTNGSAITTQFAVAQPGNDRPAVYTLTGLLALAAIGLVAQDLWKSKARKSEKPNFFHHLHPPTIPAPQARLRYTLGGGGIAVFLCFVLLVTGILEMFYYIPVPEHAAVSVEVITSLVPFGALIRNLHFWAAQALMIVMSMHLLRVVLTGAYARHRRLNYLIGLGMFLLVTMLDFTGYVLRWDEGIRWALVVGTNLLKTVPWIGDWLYQLTVGGPEPGFSSLERFYTWHIFVLTLGMIILGAWHIFRVRRDGGVAVPPPDRRADQTRISRFDLVRREVAIMAVSAVLLLFVSIGFPAPIERPITQTAVIVTNARAPWFFLWVQQLLKFGDPFTLGVALPVLLLIMLALLPYILPQARDHEFGGWLPQGNRVAQIITILLAMILIVLTLLAIVPTTKI